MSEIGTEGRRKARGIVMTPLESAIAEIEARARAADEALGTLQVAVNDKVNDPGATAFIKQARAQIVTLVKGE